MVFHAAIVTTIFSGKNSKDIQVVQLYLTVVKGRKYEINVKSYQLIAIPLIREPVNVVFHEYLLLQGLVLRL